MKIKRFTGSDMHQVIRKGQDTFGPNAVILLKRTQAEVVEGIHGVLADAVNVFRGVSLDGCILTVAHAHG